MAKTDALFYALNRGLIAARALARVDLKRYALSATEQVNWMSRSLGSMGLRAGLGYIGATLSNAACRGIGFVAAVDATAILEFTNLAMRIWVADTLLTRVSVATTVANGTFNANLASWTDNDEAGGVSAWVTGGYMGLTGNGTAAAIRDQVVTVAAVDLNKEHGLRVVIKRGPVTFRVGSTVGGDEYISETTLYTGQHSIALTPTGDFNIRFLSTLKRQVLVDSCTVEAAGVVALTSPYASADLGDIRADENSQSADVLFVGCEGYQQRRIERRSARSWSLVLYENENGPFRTTNTSTLTMTPSALSGNGTLTASRAFFRSTHAPSATSNGALFRVTSTGQTVTASIAAQNTFTSAIRVTGTSTDRAFTINIDNVGAGTTITLQRSLDSATGPWTDVASKTWTAATAESYNDTLDNQIIWYRIGCKTGDYGAGTSVCTLVTAIGAITGVCRVTGFTSSTQVAIEIITDFGATTASDDWAEGRWSDYRGWPTAGALYDGRLWWAGNDRTQGSESDAFDSFDPDTEGDSGPIDRSIGAGPVAKINWILPLQRLMLGAQMAEYSVRSSTLDEPITPTNFNCKPASTQGSYAVPAVKIDSSGAFVQRGGTRIFELSMQGETYDYGANDLTVLTPDVCTPYVVRMAVQRQPDTRLHCVLSDGTVAVLVWDRMEKVTCWQTVETDGTVEDVVVLPAGTGVAEDRVYYVVARTIGGATVRHWEKWALESECIGGTVNKQADAFVTFTNSPASNFITGLSHLNGETVVVWADGKCLADAAGDIATFTVSGGQLAATDGGAVYYATTGVVGLAYQARWKSAKLGQTLGKHMLVHRIAAILQNTHAQGLKMGQDYTTMDNLPLTYQGAPVDPDTVYAAYDEESQAFPGTWDTDARICLEANAPRPAYVLGFVIDGEVYA